MRAAILKSQMELLAAQGKPVAPALEETNRRYADEEKSISAAANELEKMRDEKDEEANLLIHRHHYYASRSPCCRLRSRWVPWQP
ncbi:hypothetical protein [Rhizobium sp. IMFF44]|uniref:hypothetical protein n=1 Tax=Rhizobium sp. IMFF44 TaxID=3342350 RepID=UPI0035BB1E10